MNYNCTNIYYNFTAIIGFKCKNTIVQIILDTETHLPGLEESLKMKKKNINENSDEVNYNCANTYYNFKMRMKYNFLHNCGLY